MDRKIVINADDFGLCEAVNEAVVKAHTGGVLTSAALMANMPAAEKAVEIAKKLPSLGVGVHLNLTRGRPLCSHPSMKVLLDEKGEFACSPARLGFLFLVMPKAKHAIRAEISAQIQWVIDKGIRPTHLDSHRHFHAFPPVFSLLCRLARQFGIRAIRFLFEPKQVSRMPWPLTGEGGKTRARAVRAMAKINRMQNSDFLKTEACLGLAHTGKIDVSFFKALALYNPARISEVITHPAFDEGLDPSLTTMVQQRKTELDALCSDKTRELLKDAGIKLVHYGQL